MYAYIKYVATGLVQRIPAESLEAFLSDENDEVVVAEESEWTEPAENAADGEVVVAEEVAADAIAEESPLAEEVAATEEAA